MLDIWNLEWVNQNSIRAYPLSSTSTRKNTSGDFQLPDDILVGLSIFISGDIGDYALDTINMSKFFLSHVGLSQKSCTFEISYDDVVIATATCDITQQSSALIPTTVNLVPLNSTLLTGHITINNLIALYNLPNGYWDFDVSGGQIDPDVIHIQPANIKSVSVETENGIVKLTGPNITIKAGNHIKLTVTKEDNQDIIEISDTDLSDTEIAKLTLGTVKTLNGIEPDDSGNISLVAGECLYIENDANSHALYLSETCADPCCGCEELNTIQDKTNEFTTVINTINALMLAISNKLLSTDNDE